MKKSFLCIVLLLNIALKSENSMLLTEKLCFEKFRKIIELLTKKNNEEFGDAVKVYNGEMSYRREYKPKWIDNNGMDNLNDEEKNLIAEFEQCLENYESIESRFLALELQEHRRREEMKIQYFEQLEENKTKEITIHNKIIINKE